VSLGVFITSPQYLSSRKAAPFSYSREYSRLFHPLNILCFTLISVRKIMLTSLHTFIGFLYLTLGTLGGSLGTAFALCTRFELGMPGYVRLGDNFHSYNV
jgi:hypothetical protein